MKSTSVSEPAQNPPPLPAISPIYRDHGVPLGENENLGRTMPNPSSQQIFCRPVDEYRGMWHGQTALPDSPYAWKYSGGLATYPYQTRPMAVYAQAVHRTFFCYGGTYPDNHRQTERIWDFAPGNLLQMISYYDHQTQTFAQPIAVFDKWCSDPHDNPALQIDPEGFLWLFSPSHGDWTTRSFIHRSARPYDITEWHTICDGPLFAYPQPWIHPQQGWCMVHVIYNVAERGLFVKHSSDGHSWSNPKPIANIARGHYGVSWADPKTGRIALAFDYHPEEGGLEARTNLYYLESWDWGQTWQTISRQSVDLPITEIENPALAVNLTSSGELNYLRDVKFDNDGNPVIVFVSSKGWMPGPENGPHEWNIVRWDGSAWRRQRAMRCSNNYDHGELAIAPDGTWSIIAPTEDGPQPGNPGGEVALWISNDKGLHWHKERLITSESPRNHTFCRRPLNAHPDFAAFWADGNPREPSESGLYCCAADGSRLQRIEAGVSLSNS